MTLDPRDRVPCSCARIALERGLWTECEEEILDRWGLHRPILDCVELARLDSERAGLVRRLGL